MDEPKRGRGRPKKRTFEDIHEERTHLYHPKKIPGGWQVGGIKLPAANRYTALLFAFKHAATPEAKEYLFWEIADHLWNKDPNDPKFVKHRWSWLMIHHACRERYLAVGGAGSSGKSYTMAGWAIINWLSDPANVQVLMTSTDLGGARGRIWGAAMKLLDMVPDPPCKIRDAIGVVAYYDGNTAFSTSGIKLLTADKSKGRVSKMIGHKARFVLLIADEIGEMGSNVQQAATSNLSSNDRFQMIGLSNPASRFDSFGIYSEPKRGWDSINVEMDYEWRTKLNGLYIRLDSEDSPMVNRVDSPEYVSDIFLPYLPTQAKIDEQLQILGATPEEARKSREYMRFWRALFFDSDDDENFYTESEFIRAKAQKGGEPRKLTNPVKIAGFDPSFSSNGDKSVLTIVEVGFDQYGRHSIVHKEQIVIYEDMTNKDDPRNLQIAEKVMKLCIDRKIDVHDLGVDASGAGGGFCDMLQLVWKPGFLRVQFGGAPSDKKIKNDSKVTAKERYKNRASELFFIGKNFLLAGQMADIPPVIIQQMCTRQYLTSKGPKGIVLQVQPKKEYKANCGSSPDETDSFLVAVEVARTRHLLTPSDPVKLEGSQLRDFLQNRRTTSSYACDKMGFVANIF